MPTMTIEVQETKKALEGKARGRIIDASGMTFQADKAMLASVVLGGKYDITYNDETFRTPDGKDLKYRVISEVQPVGKDSMTTVVPAKPSLPNPVPVYSDTKTEDISALAIIKSMQIDPEASAVYSALKEAAIGWRRYKKWQKTLASDMDDEIPYDR